MYSSQALVNNPATLCIGYIPAQSEEFNPSTPPPPPPPQGTEEVLLSRGGSPRLN